MTLSACYMYVSHKTNTFIISIIRSVCVFVCHDVFLDDLTKKDWFHKHNILLIHRLGCIVVAVMCRKLMTASMTPPKQKVGRILKLPITQFLSYSMETNIVIICLGKNTLS